MAQTISELEKERAKLLEAIEAQASQISTKRTPSSSASSNEARPHTLNDWLNAAEQVMPVSQNASSSSSRDSTRQQSRPASNKPPMNTPNNKVSFFGVIIMLSLLLTVIGVVYIAYTTIQKDLQQMSNIHNETIETMAQLQEDMIALRETVEQGGNSDAFEEVNARLDQYEQELSGLKHLQANMQNQRARINPNALNDVTQTLERQMESRLQGLVDQLKQSGLALEALNTDETQQEATQNEMSVNEPQVAEPQAPSVPRIEEKLVRLVETKSSQEEGVVWLKQQTPEHYVLQLASMQERAGIEKIIADKNIKNAQIIPQIRDGKQSYVLVLGPYSQRTQANQASIEVKEETKISPWIRRVRDLSNRLE
ncbi:SPOR domain-containing protein [Thiomicrospira sp.]|uniref:SPOR domain-containing protein n=1 Tax=Thiomicrospira sp. TaxID=935 RepID=UPI002F939246